MGPGSGRLRRFLLVASMGVVSLNLWTGSPLLALWVGARVQGSGPPRMAAVGVFALVMGLLSFVLVRLLGALGRAHDRLTGRHPTVRRHVPWLRSLRAERPSEPGSENAISPLERILVATVMLAVAAFEIWFFFFSGSSLDQGGGR